MKKEDMNIKVLFITNTSKFFTGRRVLPSVGEAIYSGDTPFVVTKRIFSPSKEFIAADIFNDIDSTYPKVDVILYLSEEIR